MLRGHQSVYAVLFTDADTTTLAAPERKGRSESLIKQRNQLLIARYYYYAKIHDKRYSFVLGKLKKEFFLEERTIQDVITAERAMLMELRDLQPGIAHFKKLYPWLNWELA